MTERDDVRPTADDMTRYDQTTADTIDEQTVRDRQLDETRRDDLGTRRAGTATAGTPEHPSNWDREEWEGQNQTRKANPDVRGTIDEAVTGAARWNEGEVVGEGQGGPDEGPTTDVVPSEGENELSGHGHNPGGGERWADVDRS